MKYEVYLVKTESKFVEVFADTPHEALAKVQVDGFVAECLDELIGPEERGQSWDVYGKCAGCGIALLEDSEFESDESGDLFCSKCTASILSDSQAPRLPKSQTPKQ